VERFVKKSFEIRALMVTLDPWLASIFKDLSKDLGIDAQSSASSSGVTRELGSMNYESVLIDFDTISDPLPVLASVRESRSSKEAFVFAVATPDFQRHQAIQQGADFVFQRPVLPVKIWGALNSAYGRMVNQRRSSFRYSTELSVFLTRGVAGGRFQATTMNISSNGMSTSSGNHFTPGEKLSADLGLPQGGMIHGIATTIWDDKHGRTGFALQYTPKMQARLDSWLDAQFALLLSPNFVA
jgi:hypothetical protein